MLGPCNLEGGKADQNEVHNRCRENLAEASPRYKGQMNGINTIFGTL